MINPGAGAEFRRGWKSLVGSSVGIGFGLSGVPYYTFGVFVIPLMTAFGWTRGQTTVAASFLILGTAITALIVGAIIDRYGARRVALISMVAVSLGYVALTQIDGSIATFYATWLLLSLAGGGTTPVVWTRAVNMWFDKGRGLALGLTLAGSGMSGIIGPYLCAMVIAAYGWQAGYLAIAASIVLIAIPAVFVLFRERQPETTASHLAVTAPGMTLAEAIRTVAFWKIAGGFILISATVAALLINLVPLLSDRGLTAVEAARIAGVLGIAVVVGRIFVGGLVDRFSGSVVARILLSSTAVGCLLLTLEGTPTWVALISVVMFGLAAAAEVDLLAFLTSRYFGMRAYGKIYGFQIMLFYAGAAAGPFVAGLAYDRFHTYLQVLYICAGLLVVGALILGTLGKPPVFESADDR